MTPTSDRPTVVLVGTLDTKGREYAYLREAIEAAGAATILVDTGVLGEPQVRADITREEVAPGMRSWPGRPTGARP